MNKRIMWITRTAILIAILILFQFLGKQLLLNQLILGSLVNLVLIVSVIMVGTWGGVSVAMLSPIFAFLLQVGPSFFPIIPAIMLGNAVYVLVFAIILSLFNKIKVNNFISYPVSVIVGSLLKFATLTVTVSYLIKPLFMTNLPAKQVQIFVAMFSYPQIITALIGGFIAISISPIIKKSLPN